MDSVVGEESLATGGVSAEEIASALAQSIPTLPTRLLQNDSQGRPPSLVPAGRPPVAIPHGRPPAPVPQSSPLLLPAMPSGPPYRQAVTTGWTMEQWKFYGHKWLEQQGQQ